MCSLHELEVAAQVSLHTSLTFPLTVNMQTSPLGILDFCVQIRLGPPPKQSVP